jgi:hypothetical protein
MTEQLRYLDVVILLVIGCVGMYVVPAMIDGYRKFNNGRELARQVEGEQTAREFLREDWQRSHGS